MSTHKKSTELVIPLGNTNSTSSGIDPVAVKKLIIDTRNAFLHLRQIGRVVWKAKQKYKLKLRKWTSVQDTNILFIVKYENLRKYTQRWVLHNDSWNYFANFALNLSGFFKTDNHTTLIRKALNRYRSFNIICIRKLICSTFVYEISTAGNKRYTYDMKKKIKSSSHYWLDV